MKSWLHKIDADWILRVSAGLFFIIPGLFKVLSPGDFSEFLNYFPGYFEAISHVLFWGVTALQIIGGGLLLWGKQFRAAVVPLAIVSIVALLTTVPQDNGSAIQYLSTLSHIMTFGIFMGLFLIGPKTKDITEILHPKDPTRGWDLTRLSLSFFWIGLGLGIFFAPQLMAGIPKTLPFDFGFWSYAIIGLISVIAGFFMLTRYHLNLATKLSVVGFLCLIILIAIPDMQNSIIGLINLLFFVLGAGVSLALSVKK